MIENRILSTRYRSDGKATVSLNELQRRYIDEFLRDKRIQYDTLEHCPFCQFTEFIIVAEKDRYGISLPTALCKKCGLIFSHKQFRKDSHFIFYQEYYRKIYEGIENPSQDYILKTYLKNKELEAIPKFLKRDDIVLEIGTGGGRNLLKFKTNEIKHFGFDFDKQYIDVGRNHRGLNLYYGGFPEIKAMSIKANYVLCLHVLEHTKDPVMFLSDIRDVMADDAILNLQVPATNFLLFGGGATGIDLMGTLQNAHNFLFDEVILKYIGKLTGYQILSAMGGHFILQKTKKIPNIINEAKRSLNELNRGEKIYQYLQQIEKTLPLRRKLCFGPPRLSGHYVYYLAKPLSLIRKILLYKFGII